MNYLKYPEKSAANSQKAQASGLILEEDQTAVILEKDNVQFGPYTSLNAGVYQLIITGKNLTHASYHACYKVGTVEIPLINLEVTDDRVTYYLQVDSDDIEDAEFVTTAQSDDVMISDITIQKQ